MLKGFGEGELVLEMDGIQSAYRERNTVYQPDDHCIVIRWESGDVLKVYESQHEQAFDDLVLWMIGLCAPRERVQRG